MDATGAANGAARGSASSRHPAPPDRRRPAPERAADVTSEFGLQAAHECGQAGLSFALETLGCENRTNLGKCAIEVAIHYDIIVFCPMRHLAAGLGHAGADHLVVVLSARMQAPLQLRNRRRQHKNADQILRKLLVQLLSPLPVDVEQHVAALLQRLLHGLARCAVEIAEHLSKFQQLTGASELVEALAVDEMIMSAIDFAAPLGTRGNRDRKLDTALLGEE